MSVPGALIRAARRARRRGRAPWTLLRPRASLAEPAGDVDVLVAPADARARRARSASAEGFLRCPCRGPDLHLACHDAAAGRFVWVHVQDALRLAGGALPAAAVLAGAVRDGEGGGAGAGRRRAALDPAAARARRQGRRCPSATGTAVRRLAAAWDGGPPELRRARAPPRDRAGRRRRRGRRRRLGRACSRLARPSPGARRGGCRLASPRSPRDLRRGRAAWGISVAVLGPDGAGKTTLVEGLAASLPLPTRIQYMGLTGGRTCRRPTALRVPGLVFAARLAILWSRWLRGAFYRARGRIVLFDRYTLDGAVPSGMRAERRRASSRGALQRRALPAAGPRARSSTRRARRCTGARASTTRRCWSSGGRRTRGCAPAASGLEVLDAEQPAERVRAQAEAAVLAALRRAGATRAERR